MEPNIEINVEDKKVLIRTDYDVPLNNGRIVDDSRLRDSSDTIKWLIKNGACVIICSSIGRPDDREKKTSLRHIIQSLSIILGVKIIFFEDCIGETRDNLINNLNKGQVLLLENVRFYKEEYANDIDFSKLLSKNIDVYVNDAFGNSHRAHASMVGAPSYIPMKALGFHIQKELYKIDKFFKNNESPKIGIIGGNKVEKIEAVSNLITKLDKIFIVGDIANYFLVAVHCKSQYKNDEAIYEKCREIYNKVRPNYNFFLPLDLISTKNNFFSPFSLSVSELNANIKSEKFLILDIGNKTINSIKELVRISKSVIWNGPAGKYEDHKFCHGSNSIVEILDNSKIHALVGGGDTLTILNRIGIHNPTVNTVSGGGALLAILKGKNLIAIEALLNGKLS